MPSIEENLSKWGASYTWSRAGDEWSKPWGSSYMQWHGSILPRIGAFLPAPSILEIAPGFGRWTDFLKESCDRLTVVDISEKCIEACRQRFADEDHIAYHVNDGSSLAMVPDESIDFVFSYDSLVHAEDSVLESYIREFSRILKPDGVAFIHHSNLGEYEARIAMQSRLGLKDEQIARIPKLSGLLQRLRVYDNVTTQWRARSMTHGKLAGFADAHGLQCISQELVSWASRFALVDCMSTLTRKGSRWARPNKVLRNPAFMREAKHFSRLSQLYGSPN